MAIVLCFLGAIPLLYAQFGLSGNDSLALAGAGALVALIGFLDDHGHIAARWRLLTHFGASAWALYWLAGAPPLSFGETTIELGPAGFVLGAIFLVWMLNLYNFMDGIDGIASVEAICVCLGGALMYWITGEVDAAIVPLTLAASVCGFLAWNFPPARIFMGDAGSGFIGMALALFSLQAGWHQPTLFWAWLILLGVFVVDATTTLIRRLLRGEKVYEAHRSHAYQFAAREYGCHLPVTARVAAINLGWLLPFATAVTLETIDGFVGLMLAYLPLIALALKFRAGTPE
ncbi:MAG: glycosyltransferase family 4 protein [Azoarcus sp.]|nr:glycosyltransferase family 4 protein [Azoarcus sp.]